MLQRLKCVAFHCSWWSWPLGYHRDGGIMLMWRKDQWTWHSVWINSILCAAACHVAKHSNHADVHTYRKKENLKGSNQWVITCTCTVNYEHLYKMKTRGVEVSGRPAAAAAALALIILSQSFTVLPLYCICSPASEMNRSVFIVFTVLICAGCHVTSVQLLKLLPLVSALTISFSIHTHTLLCFGGVLPPIVSLVLFVPFRHLWRRTCLCS